MTREGLAAKTTLDVQLSAGTGDVNIALGPALYDEMGKDGLITLERCRAVGFTHEILWTMYGHGRFVRSDWTLQPYEFVVGKGGV